MEVPSACANTRAGRLIRSGRRLGVLVRALLPAELGENIGLQLELASVDQRRAAAGVIVTHCRS